MNQIQSRAITLLVVITCSLNLSHATYTQDNQEKTEKTRLQRLNERYPLLKYTPLALIPALPALAKRWSPRSTSTQPQLGIPSAPSSTKSSRSDHSSPAAKAPESPLPQPQAAQVEVSTLQDIHRKQEDGWRKKHPIKNKTGLFETVVRTTLRTTLTPGANQSTDKKEDTLASALEPHLPTEYTRYNDDELQAMRSVYFKRYPMQEWTLSSLNMIEQLDFIRNLNPNLLSELFAKIPASSSSSSSSSSSNSPLELMVPQRSSSVALQPETPNNWQELAHQQENILLSVQSLEKRLQMLNQVNEIHAQQDQSPSHPLESKKKKKIVREKPTASQNQLVTTAPHRNDNLHPRIPSVMKSSIILDLNNPQVITLLKNLSDSNQLDGQAKFMLQGLLKGLEDQKSQQERSVVHTRPLTLEIPEKYIPLLVRLLQARTYRAYG